MKVDSELAMVEEPPAPMISPKLVESLLRTGGKDLSIQRHQQEYSGDSTQVVEVANQGEKLLLDVVNTSLNNDFAHECLDLAIRRLGASHLPAIEQDIGPQVFAIPGIPKGRFLPHQVWGIWFLVDRVIGNSPPPALLADNMGLGKTFTAQRRPTPFEVDPCCGHLRSEISLSGGPGCRRAWGCPATIL